MASWWILQVALCVAGYLVTVHGLECDDIDTQACKLMQDKEPDMCQIEALANTACPRFCNICPLECYHCNTTLSDYHDCTTTVMCDDGEVCMMKKLMSSVDGHEEYELTCEAKEACDGVGMGFDFESRDIQARDLSITCCDLDMCNYPVEPLQVSSTPAPSVITTTTESATTQPDATTTASPVTSTAAPTASPATVSGNCAVDLILVVDESARMTRFYERGVMQFLHNVVLATDVSEAGTHVSLGTFGLFGHERFDLDEHTSQESVLAALDAVHLSGLPQGDVDAGLEYIINTAMTSDAGDRTNAQNVVIMVTADGAQNDYELHALEIAVNTLADVVITIELGRTNVHYENTDDAHIYHVRDGRDLDDILDDVTSQICP